MTKHRATPWFGTLRAIFIIRILSFLASILANLCSSPCLHIPVITDRHCSLFRFLRVTVALDEGQEIVFALRHLKPAKTSPSDRGKREEERMTTKEQSFANFLLIVYRASAFILFVWRNSVLKRSTLWWVWMLVFCSHTNAGAQAQKDTRT